MTAEHSPTEPEPAGDALEQAQLIINNAYLYGEAAANEAQFLLYGLDDRDHDVAVLHETQAIVDESLDRFPTWGEAIPDPVGQTLLAVIEAEQQIEVEAAARHFMELNNNDPRLVSPKKLMDVSLNVLQQLINENTPQVGRADSEPTEQAREGYMRSQNPIDPRKPRNEIAKNIRPENQHPDYRPQNKSQDDESL